MSRVAGKSCCAKWQRVWDAFPKAHHPVEDLYFLTLQRGAHTARAALVRNPAELPADVLDVYIQHLAAELATREDAVS